MDVSEFGVSPAQFVPLAEESGCIVTLGAWVMEQAVREAAQWMRDGMPIVVSVNVSALEFRQADFVERLTRLLAVHQLPPTLLELELTETILLQDAHEMELRLGALSELGVSLAIDDFGTGSSLVIEEAAHPQAQDRPVVRAGLPETIVTVPLSVPSSACARCIEGVAEVWKVCPTRRAAADAVWPFSGYLCSPGMPSASSGNCWAVPGLAQFAPECLPPRPGRIARSRSAGHREALSMALTVSGFFSERGHALPEHVSRQHEQQTGKHTFERTRAAGARAHGRCHDAAGGDDCQSR